MCSRLAWLVGALRSGSSIIRGLSSIVTAAWSASSRDLAEKEHVQSEEEKLGMLLGLC
jgi:hypothetical protein